MGTSPTAPHQLIIRNMVCDRCRAAVARLLEDGQIELGADELTAEAQARAADLGQRHMARLTEGLGLPPGMKLPF